MNKPPISYSHDSHDSHIIRCDLPWLCRQDPRIQFKPFQLEEIVATQRPPDK